MVKNPPANAGDTASFPGRCHRATKAHVPQLLSLCSRAHAPKLESRLHEGGCEPLLEKAVKGVLRGRAEKDLPPAPFVTLQRSVADPLGGVLRPRLCP